VIPSRPQDGQDIRRPDAGSRRTRHCLRDQKKRKLEFFVNQCSVKIEYTIGYGGQWLSENTAQGMDRPKPSPNILRSSHSWGTTLECAHGWKSSGHVATSPLWGRPLLQQLTPTNPSTHLNVRSSDGQKYIAGHCKKLKNFQYVLQLLSLPPQYILQYPTNFQYYCNTLLIAPLDHLDRRPRHRHDGHQSRTVRL
jgi:hypothetical protein